MKRVLTFAALIIAVAMPAAFAQSQPVSQPSGQKTLAATLNVFVFPTKGQVADKQSQDEAACYNWAVQNTGNDPFDLAKRTQQQQQQAEGQKEQIRRSGQGAGARGAVSGAAMGALIGEIANDDAGEGAAWGAAAGMIGGRRRARTSKQQAEQQVDQRSQQHERATQQDIENFKKAFSVCLEAKDYMVKF